MGCDVEKYSERQDQSESLRVEGLILSIGTRHGGFIQAME